jgi:hypothetical protein
VVAALVAAATFQVVINPHGGVWQDTNDNHYAGKTIMASNPRAYKAFIFCNLVAFSLSGLVIFFLVFRYLVIQVTRKNEKQNTRKKITRVDEENTTKLQKMIALYALGLEAIIALLA